jgi:hypothetical protein
LIRRISPRRIEVLDAERLRLFQRGPRRCNNKAQPASTNAPGLLDEVPVIN